MKKIIFEIGRRKLLSIFYWEIWQQDALIPTNLVGYTKKSQ